MTGESSPGRREMDLRDFIEQLKQIGELREIEGADWNLEIGGITELMTARQGPALLFDNIKDYPRGFRVLSGFLNNPRLISSALAAPMKEISPLVRWVKERFAQMQPIKPIEVSNGPVLENIQEGDEVDLLRFPAPKWHEQDGGRYLGTGDLVIMKNPVGNWINVGTYRLQLLDRNTLGTYIAPGHHGNLIRQAYWSRGESCPVVAVFGIHPAIWIPSIQAFPWGTSELDMAGGLLGRPIEVIKGKHTGLLIPAYSEIAIEGECLPPGVESREEGPFGEWTGYYASGVQKAPIIKVNRVMYRNDPIITGAPPLKPPASAHSTHFFKAVCLWQELEDMGIPGIKGVWQMSAGGSKYFTVISLEQKYAGHAKQVATAAMSTPEGGYCGRFIIVVDEDIDPTNDGDVLWAVGTRCDPATSIDILRDCWTDPLDPLLTPEKRAERNFSSSRAIVNACRPFHWRDRFPRVSTVSNELKAELLNKWKELFVSM
jgi:UbiD family decarboxylase